MGVFLTQKRLGRLFGAVRLKDAKTLGLNKGLQRDYPIVIEQMYRRYSAVQAVQYSSNEQAVSLGNGNFLAFVHACS
jgi:hypothetical protein